MNEPHLYILKTMLVQVADLQGQLAASERQAQAAAAAAEAAAKAAMEAIEMANKNDDDDDDDDSGSSRSLPEVTDMELNLRLITSYCDSAA